MRQPLRARNTHKILSLVRLRIPIAIGILSDKKGRPITGATSPNRCCVIQHPYPRLSSLARRRPHATLHLLFSAGFQNHQKILCGYINIRPGALRGVCLCFWQVFHFPILSGDFFTISLILTVCDSSFLPILSSF